MIFSDTQPRDFNVDHELAGARIRRCESQRPAGKKK
jgi:hypothetical protein